MGLIFLFRRMVFAQVLLGIVAFCMAESNPGLLLVAGSLGALSWYVVEGPTGKPLPQWMIILGAMIAVAGLGFELAWQKGQVIVVMCHFTIWLQILLLYAKKDNREYGEILVLSLMIMTGASVITVSMVFGILLIVYCVMALFTLILFHLKATSDQVLEANQKAVPAEVPLPRPKAVVCRGHRWHFRLFALVIGIGCAWIGAVVFMVMPRSGESRMHPTLGAGLAGSQSGFNSKITLDGKPINDGPRTPVMYVKLEENGVAVQGSDHAFLLRGAALDRYSSSSRTWTRSGSISRGDVIIKLPPGGLELLAGQQTMPVLEANIAIRGSDHQHLFTLAQYPPIFFQSDQLTKVVFNKRDFQIRVSSKFYGTLNYSLRSPLAFPVGFEEAYMADLSESAYLTRSQEQRRPRARKMVKSYAAGWPDKHQRAILSKHTRRVLRTQGFKGPLKDLTADQTLEVAQLLSKYLRDNFRYDLESPSNSANRQPISKFLLSTKSGHCELFASGLAAMARSIGIRARLITGYRAGEYNRIGGYYVVRQSNAHAWTEIYCPGRGWLPFDATPPDAVAREHAAPDSWLSGMRELYEHMEFLWVSKVVSFDAKKQEEMLKETTHSLQAATRTGVSRIDKIVKWLKGIPKMLMLDQLSYVMMGTIGFFIIVGLSSLTHSLIMRKRRLTALQLQRLSRKERKALAKRLKWYLTMLDMLERHGYIRPLWQSPLDFSRELAAANPMRFNPVVVLTEVFYEIRFGQRLLNEARNTRIKSQMQRLEAALARK